MLRLGLPWCIGSRYAVHETLAVAETLCGKDVNDLCAISVAKETRIKDVRLAVLTYGASHRADQR